ncbi:hypothetical protein AVEN_168157-1 [Araneus ventricosus]|uniref:Uncharacterized protein n=1 Tax=Araneus ventricosus TaxID=182803 RepID=A0A4Y2W3I5_ARAVE|nr:hypothetical protein AVEN_168157-1 [Araneus ventricosus]
MTRNHPGSSEKQLPRQDSETEVEAITGHSPTLPKGGKLHHQSGDAITMLTMEMRTHLHIQWFLIHEPIVTPVGSEVCKIKVIKNVFQTNELIIKGGFFIA